MKKVYAARWPITELRDIGEGIPKEVGHKQRAREKMVQTRHITRKIPAARKHLWWSQVSRVAQTKMKGCRHQTTRASWANSVMTLKLGSHSS